MHHQIEKRIKEIALQASSQHDCRLYDLYKNRDGLKVLIDKSDSSKKVGIQDCEKVFRSFSFLLGTEFPELSKLWRLEVSSPGIERKLREKWHFEESVGQTIRLKTSRAIDSELSEVKKTASSESLKGKLVRFSEDVLELEEEKREWKVPFSEVEFGQVIFLSPQPNKKKLSKNKKKRRSSSCH